jgi:adenylate kinase family enzyme
MAIVLVGASNSGKSAIAKALKEELGYKVYQGRDYLNLGRNEHEAWIQLTNMLVNKNKGIIYVVGNTEKYDLLKQIEGITIIKITAPITYMREKLMTKLDAEILSNEDEEKISADFERWSAISEEYTFTVGCNEDIDGIVTTVVGIIENQIAAQPTESYIL